MFGLGFSMSLASLVKSVSSAKTVSSGKSMGSVIAARGLAVPLVIWQ